MMFEGRARESRASGDASAMRAFTRPFDIGPNICADTLRSAPASRHEGIVSAASFAAKSFPRFTYAMSAADCRRCLSKHRHNFMYELPPALEMRLIFQLR